MNDRVKKRFARNHLSLSGNYRKNIVNLEYWTGQVNIGDQLSPIIFQWMLQRKGLSLDSPAIKTAHLLALGSIIGEKPFDAVIWGSGLHTYTVCSRVNKWRKVVKYDIRALRGPLTEVVLKDCGYDCENICFGDPAVLMPLIYFPEKFEKKHKCSVIQHIGTRLKHVENVHYIDARTDDYQCFINDILSSEMIISSSLHGIILAEAYGVPAIFLNEAEKRNCEIMKYYDWYYSTGRYTVTVATSVEEALEAACMSIPELHSMQEQLIAAFPYDLWVRD